MRTQSATSAGSLVDLLFDRAGTGLCLVAPDGTVLRANAEWLRSTRFSPEQVLGADIISLFPESRDLALALHARARSGHRVAVPPHAVPMDGRETWWEGSIDPVEMERGTGLLITARQVTTPGAPSPSVEELYERLFRYSTYGVLLATIEGQILRANASACAMLDRTEDQIRSAGRRGLIVESEISAAMLAERDRHGVVQGEVQLLRPDGETFPAELTSAILPIDGGERYSLLFFRDVSRRKRAHEALRESEDRARRRSAELEAVLDAVPAAVFLTRDREARMMEANRFCNEMLRVPAHTNVSQSAPASERPRNFRAMRRGVEIPPEELPVQVAAARGEEVRDCELDLVFEDGEIRHLLGNATPLFGPDGEPAGAVGAFVDITARKATEEALRTSEARLREANEQLREVDRRKNDFLAMLSHELRNPLAPLRNATYLLDRVSADSPAAERARGVLRRQSAHLTRLVDDLLDVTRIARGKITLERARIDLRELVARAAEDLRPVMADRGVAFHAELPEAGVWVEADATRVTQVVANLLHNAAKFTRSGDQVVLSLRREAGQAEIRVLDTGAGIDEAALPRVFEPFVQADRTAPRSEGGLGLGLALVKGIVELHGGAVSAASAGAGKGAEFVIRLPALEEITAAPSPPGA